MSDIGLSAEEDDSSIDIAHAKDDGSEEEVLCIRIVAHAEDDGRPAIAI